MVLHLVSYQVLYALAKSETITTQKDANSRLDVESISFCSHTPQNQRLAMRARAPQAAFTARCISKRCAHASSRPWAGLRLVSLRSELLTWHRFNVRSFRLRLRIGRVSIAQEDQVVNAWRSACSVRLAAAHSEYATRVALSLTNDACTVSCASADGAIARLV